MRKLLTLLAAVLLTANVFAQAPQKMSYQAVIRNSGGTLVTSTQIGMEINIRQGSPTGTVVYTETQTPTTNANGLVSIEIGGGAGFSTINWGADNYYIETKTAVVAPLTTYTITGVSQLLSVPYSLTAKTVEKVDYSQITGTPNLSNFITTETDSTFTKWDKSTGITITKNQISNFPTNVSTFVNDANYLTTEVDGSVTNEIEMPSDVIAGDMSYFNGTAWIKVPAGTVGQVLTMGANGAPEWQNQVGAPTCTIQPPTNINTTSATLNGIVNGNGLSSSVVFEYGTTTSYSNNTTAIQSPVTGNLNTNTSATITGLIVGTTYHSRIKTTNASNTVYSEDITFVASLPPSITPPAISNLTATSVTFSSLVNANGLLTTVTYEYGLTSTYGYTIAATSGTVSGSTNTATTANLNGLTENTTYHYRIVTVNSYGTSYSNDLTFTTYPIPKATTQTANDIAQTIATLNGIVNASGYSSTITFEYGTTTAYGSSITATPGTIGTAINTNVSASITTLTANTVYHYRVVIVNAYGTVYSDDFSFTTLTNTLPTATTTVATVIFSTGAKLNGIVNAQGLSTTVQFEFGTTTAYGNTIAATQSPVIGSINTNISANLTGLILGQTYYFRVKAVNTLGTTYGSQMSFKTILVVGDSYQGGIIAYIFQNSDPGYIAGETHGLIAAPSDQSTGIKWFSGGYIYTGAEGEALGTGNANTNKIVSIQGVGSYAAKLCYDLVINGYSDWYLPSVTELGKLYLNKTAVGGFASAYYWSSTENHSMTAWFQGFGNGNLYLNNKNATFYVRAVRAF